MTILAVHPRTESPTLAANLTALERRSPRAAAQVRAATPRLDVDWVNTDEPGAWSAVVDGRALASKRRPREEGERLAGAVDLRRSGGVVVLGFGLGYHVAELVRRGRPHSAVIVFEPDVSLLRCVLERCDFSEILGSGHLVVFTEPDNTAAVTAALEGLEAPLAVGIEIVEHPPSRARLGDSGKVFAETLTRVVASLRTQVITTMVQMDVTVRNLLMNADHYALGAGVAELAGIARHAPAVVVSAGPSLRRNVDLLSTPGLRDRCVIVAVQTVLKQLLERGIRPHFVTALDYHEISTRFYEGLTPEDVRGITLVAEPKANPAILQAFPGMVRLVEADFLEESLGRELAPAHGAIAPGATVAHLAYSLARHLGCDPVVLIGQDLAFTDGQYYAAGAAIHDVWSPELNPFNTLEMMEWQRIIRWRGHLHTRRDHLGRPVYTDDQMCAYLAQFERDFLADADRGLITIDATEGGVRKEHTRVMALREALDRHAPPGSPALPAFPDAARDARPSARRRLRQRLDFVRADVRRVARGCREAAGLLGSMLGVQHDPPRINALIEQVDRVRDRVQRIQPAYGLVHRMNQAGAFKRFKADRAMALDDGLSPLDQQRRQIERDGMNVNWLGDAADALDELLGATLRMLDGGPRRTRDLPPPADEEAESGSALDAPASRAKATRVAAVIPVDLDRSPLGAPRDLGAPFLGCPMLRLTLQRLARCQRLDRAVLVGADPIRIRRLIGAPIEGIEIEVLPAEAASLRRAGDSIRAARLWARTSWRGGLGHLTCYDEVFDPRLVGAALEKLGADAALVIGPDWCLADPALCDSVIERHTEGRGAGPLTFCQAPPGLAGCVVSAGLCAELDKGRELGDHFATIGGILGFNPRRPRTDAIADACCVQIPHETRRAHARLIPDTALDRSALGAALISHTRRASELSAAEIVLAVGAHADDHPPAAPEHLILELCTQRAFPAPGASEADARIERAPLGIDDAERLFRGLVEANPDAAVSFAGLGDPMCHPRAVELIAQAKRCGVRAVHVRTDLVLPPETIDALTSCDIDVISVNLHANTPEAFRRLTGTDHHRLVLENTDRLLRRRRLDAGLPHPWIVPRLTRRDAVYEELEGFFDKALFFAGAAVIDQLPSAIEGERIEPLGKPRLAARRDARTRMLVLCDGRVVADERDLAGARAVGSVLSEPLGEVWERLTERRCAAANTTGGTHPELWTGW